MFRAAQTKGPFRFSTRYTADFVRVLAPCVVVFALTFAVVIPYLINQAQRERYIQYQDFQEIIHGTFDLWAASRLDDLKAQINPVLERPQIQDLYAARQFNTLSQTLWNELAPAFARGELKMVRVRDEEGRIQMTLRASGPAPGDLQTNLDEDTSYGGVWRARNALHVTADGDARLTLVVPWSLGNGSAATVEIVDDDATLPRNVAERLGASIYAFPDPLSATITPDNVPSRMLATYGGGTPSAARQIARILHPLVATDRLGVTGIVHGHSIDIIKVAPQAGAVLTHNDLAVVHPADRRELSIRKSCAIGVLLAAILSLMIVYYTLRTSARLRNTLSLKEAARLREREERLRAVMDAVADGIAVTDANGVIRGVNHAMETLFGYTRTELTGQLFRVLMSSSLNDEQKAFARDMGHPAQMPTHILASAMTGRRKDGTTFPVELTARCTALNNERVATVVLRDTSEQQAAKDFLIQTVNDQRAAQEALSQRSDELVRAGRQLAQARDKAEAANAAKSRFLATMSHELRTPMNGILGMIGLLINSPLNAEQKAWAETLQESGDALLALLNDILDLSKIEAGKLEVQHVALDPVVLARHIATTWGPLAEAKGLSFALEAPAEGRCVLGDAVRLRQILANLVNNAIKFTDTGEVRIKVVLTARDDEHAAVRFEVSDTGIGIAHDKLALLFQKFSQVDGSLTRRHGGSGLGLAICRELAALMGGDVGVKTVEGAGSIFWVDVPCEIVTGEKWAAAARALPAAVAPEAPAPSRRLRILLAEDHPVNQSLFKALMAHLGHDLDVVDNGAQALTALQKGSYDIVLLDAHMPVMDGVEAAARIRQLAGPLARTPLVVVTADAMAGDRERYLAAGMDDYVTKPVDVRELAAVIARQTRNSAGASPARRAARAGAAE